MVQGDGAGRKGPQGDVLWGGGRQAGEGMRGGSHPLSMKTEKIWALKSPAGLQGVGARVLLWAARGLSLEMKDAVTWH